MSNFKNPKQNDKDTFYLKAFLVPKDDLGELLKIKYRHPFLSTSLCSAPFESNPVLWQSTAMPQPYLKVLDGSRSLLGESKSLAQSVWSITAWSLLTLPHIKSFFSALTVPHLCPSPSRSRDYTTLLSAHAPLFYLCLNSDFTFQGYLPWSSRWDTPRETFLKHLFMSHSVSFMFVWAMIQPLSGLLAVLATVFLFAVVALVS